MSAEGPEPPASTETEERLAGPSDQSGPSPASASPASASPASASTDPADHIADGMGYLDQAIDAFTRACEPGDAGVMPLAIELLARTLPLRGRDNDAALVWQRGLDDPGQAVSADVRTRLRRSFGGDEVPADDAAPTWWEGFVESAVVYGSLPLLTNEIFGALDQMYSLAALPLAQGGGRARDLREILLSAVRIPSEYAWGPDLHQSFHARLKEAMGTDADVLPPEWPD